MTGKRKSVDLARNETRRGSEQKTRAGSIKPFGWLRTKTTGPETGTSSTRLVSMRRKKSLSAMLMTA